MTARATDMKLFRTQSGKRLRSKEEFIKAQGDDPVCKVLIYNRKEKRVLEGYKNMRTKRMHITALRRPTGQEELELGKLITREQLEGKKDNQQQIEIITGGDAYVKRELKSVNVKVEVEK